MPKGSAKPLPRNPRPNPTYVKKDVIPSRFFPKAACTNIVRNLAWDPHKLTVPHLLELGFHHNYVESVSKVLEASNQHQGIFKHNYLDGF